MKKYITYTTLIAVAILLTLSHCKKPVEVDADKALFDKTKTGTFTFYKNDTSYLNTTSESGHAPAYFRVRFNSIAQAALTDSGRLPIGGSFPDGSLIVKELYDAPGGDRALVAIMEKAKGKVLSGADWIWGEYYGDGSSAISVNKKGKDCTNCHSEFGNRDYMRLFGLYP